MLKGNGWKKGQECAHSWLKNHPLGFIGRGKILAQALWPGMEARLRGSDGKLRAPSTQAVDVDRTYLDRDGIVRLGILNRLAFGRDGGNFEGERANRIVGSNKFDDAAWDNLATGSGSAAVLTESAALSPDGTMDAWRITFDRGAGTANSDRSVIQQFFALGVDDYTISVWLKSNTGSDQEVHFANLLSDGSVTVTPQWKRFQSTVNRSGPGLTIGTRGTTGSDQTLDILVFGAQLEDATFASSYIPTTSAGVTRAAEDVDYDNASEAIAKAAQGTVICAVTPEFNAADYGVDAFPLDMRTVSGNDGVYLFHWGANNVYAFVVISGGVNQAVIQSSTVAARGAVAVLAGVWETNNVRLYVKGAEEGINDTSVIVPAGMGNAFVGQRSSSIAQMFGNLARLLITEPVLSARQVENATAVIRRAA